MIKCLSLERSGWEREERHRRVALRGRQTVKMCLFPFDTRPFACHSLVSPINAIQNQHAKKLSQSNEEGKSPRNEKDVEVELAKPRHVLACVQK